MKLTPPQVELLTDIAAHREFGVRTYSRWGRTAGALVRLGLATTRGVEGNWTEVTITQAGRAEAARRGLTQGEESR